MAMLPYYVSPEQMMQEKGEYARKGVALGRSVMAQAYQDGILLVADNPSSLRKVSEIYDTIAFAGAGKYSEFENLRKAGIRHADLKGYLYSRQDVMPQTLVSAYSQTLGTIFSQELKPLEVEILIAGVGDCPEHNELYRISFDGSIYDEKVFTVIGGAAEAIRTTCRDRVSPTLSLKEALQLSIEALGGTSNQQIPVSSLEVAVLERDQPGRKFRRLSSAALQEILGAAP